MIGTGIDIISIERFGASLGRGPEFAERLCAECERRTCHSQRNPAQPCAERFAAKESFLDAGSLGVFGGAVPRDIAVRRAEPGKPALKLDRTAAALERAGATRAQVSLSHERECAIAVVVIA